MRYAPEKLKKIYDRSPVWIRDIFCTGYGILVNHRERSRLFHRYLAELRRSQSWGRERLDELQNQRLREMIRHCSENVSYYRKLFADHGINPSQIQTREDLKKLPLLTKKDILNNTEDLIADGYSIDELVPESSSGTTGKSLTTYWDRDDHIWSVAARYMVKERMGYREGEDWLAIMNGYKILPIDKAAPPYWIKDYFNKTVHLSAYHLSEETVVDYHRYLSRRSVKYIMGYASVIGLIARLMAERGLSLDINAVMISSEPYYDWQIESINRAFDCKIINSFGQAERVAMGGSCGQTMNIHMFDEIGIIEFAESEKHDHRRMVATGLVNHAMPLIRYDLGDISDFVREKCFCGTEHTTILPVSTKSEDFVITPEGKFISASLLTFPFKHPGGIIESQLIQTAPDRIRVNLNVSEDFDRDSEKKIEDDLRSILGDNFKIEFNYTDFIPRTGMGKFRFVISELKE